MPKIDFEIIKRTTDLVAVIEAHGVTLRKEGKDYVGLCPFHNDHKPSLHVTPGKGLWRCMSCEAAGNVIQFVAKKEAISDHEAALRLLATLPGVQRASQLEKKETPVVVPPGAAAELLGRVAAFYQRTLFKADLAGLDYLAGRNLADPAMLESFRVGYCNGTMKDALPSSHVVIKQLQAMGVLNEKGNEVFYGRVVVPIVDDAGSVVSLYGRKVEGPGAKLPTDSARHIYLTGGHRAVFNVAAVKASRALLIVESIFDCLSLWQAGHRAAVPLYGAGGWTPHHDALVQSPELSEVVLALNNDEAGRTGTLAAKEKIRALAPACAIRVLAWPEGVKDANVFFSSRPAAEFARVLDPGLSDAPASGGVAALPPRQEETAGKKTDEGTGPRLEARAGGFAILYPNRGYEVIAVEKLGAARLKATVKASGQEPGRFHAETLDLYSARCRRLFAAEVARLFRLPVEVTEADVSQILLAAEGRAGSEGAPNGSGTVPPVLSAPDRLEAMKLGKSTDLVREIARDLSKLGVIGEETNGLLLYLVMTSRKMDDPLAAHTLSSSGAGKSYLQDAVLSLCPEEDLIKLTSLTDQALFYKGEDSLRHKCLAVEEIAGAEGARYALRNLISAKKLTIEATIKNPLTGKMETQVNTVYGPTAVFETTTKPDTDAETKSRYLLLSIDESPEQTKAILEAQRQGHTLEAMVARKEREAVRRRHHALQRTLRPLTVVNPYEPLLTYGDERLSTRRDQPKYLNLILAVAFLHQWQRPVRHHAALGEYIEATLGDIAVANELAGELLGASLDDLSAPGRRLAYQLAEYIMEKTRRAGSDQESGAGTSPCFTRRELREALKWSDTRLRVHLDELIRLEYVATVCGANGLTYRYRLSAPPEDLLAGGRLGLGIKPVEQLRREADLAGLGGHLAAKNGHLAATLPVRNGEVKNGVSHETTGGSRMTRADLAGFAASPMPVVVNGAHA